MILMKKTDMIAFKEAIDAEDKRIQTDKILSECNANFCSWPYNACKKYEYRHA